MATDELTHKAAEILGQLQALSPKATEIALAAVQASAVASLCWGVIGAIGLGACILVFRKKLLPYMRETSSDEMAGTFACIGLGLVSLCFAVMTLVNLFDPWNYIALVRPELWLALRVLH